MPNNTNKKLFYFTFAEKIYRKKKKIISPCYFTKSIFAKIYFLSGVCVKCVMSFLVISHYIK